MHSWLRKILISGGNGQVAHALRLHPLANDFSIIACTHHELDITQPSAITNAIAMHRPELIINTAAFTAVDKAEREQALATQVNFLGAQHLASACEQNSIPLLHLSTDYVFDGSKRTPYQENDACAPINVYGKSKWRGEQAIRERCEKHIILRVSGVFSEYGHNFLNTILRLGQQQKELRVVADQFTCPTYAPDIARVIYTLAKNPGKWGTYHYCGADIMSWHQFAVAIISEMKKSRSLQAETIKAIKTANYPTAAQRPLYSVLDCGKIKRDYDISQTPFKLP